MSCGQNIENVRLNGTELDLQNEFGRTCLRSTAAAEKNSGHAKSEPQALKRRQFSMRWRAPFGFAQAS
jgi:hypothetical protein